MEVKHVIKLLLVFMLLPLAEGVSQEKYLQYSPQKDSIIWKGTKQFYKIDNNLFDVSRYDQIDTITSERIRKIQFISVNDLWKEGQRKTDSVINNLKDNEPITLNKTGIETNNHVLKTIYIIDKLSDCKYKRTRVWWIDY
ncbi:hypothetical protein [Sinomicrobium sp. M5D2P17]